MHTPHRGDLQVARLFLNGLSKFRNTPPMKHNMKVPPKVNKNAEVYPRVLPANMQNTKMHSAIKMVRVMADGLEHVVHLAWGGHSFLLDVRAQVVPTELRSCGHPKLHVLVLPALECRRGGTSRR